MACRQTAEGDRIVDGNAVLPVKVVNPFRVVAPVFKVLADAKGTDHLTDTVFQSRHRLPVEMVPVIMGDDKLIDFGNIIDSIDISAFERAHEPPHGQSVGQHGVEEEAHATGLNKDRGVAKPDANLFRAGDVLQR